MGKTAGKRRLGRGASAVLQELSKRGWSQSDLARELETETGSVSRWMTGSRVPSLEMAVRMKKLLGVPVEFWIEAA